MCYWNNKLDWLRPLPIACQLQNIHVASSAPVHKPCMLWEYCKHMVWTTHHYRLYRSVIISKLTYASSAWWGFTSAADRQRLEAFIRRSHRSRFVTPDLPALADICLSADKKMFSAVIRDSDHVLHKLLPPLSTASQALSPTTCEK